MIGGTLIVGGILLCRCVIPSGIQQLAENNSIHFSSWSSVSECTIAKRIIDLKPSRRYTNFMDQSKISAATQATILDAANKVLLEKGAKAFTLDAVIQEAGVSKGGLLYHFPTKKKLIEALIERMIASVDASLETELANCNGDYLTAYIRASFQPNPERDRVSSALFAAVANDTALIEPLRKRFKHMQNELVAAAGSPEIATIIRLTLDGLWVSDLFDFAPPSAALRQKMMETLLDIVHHQ